MSGFVRTTKLYFRDLKQSFLMDNKEKVRRKSWDIKFDPPKARPFSLGPEEDSIMAEILAASILSRSIIQDTRHQHAPCHQHFQKSASQVLRLVPPQVGNQSQWFQDHRFCRLVRYNLLVYLKRSWSNVDFQMKKVKCYDENTRAKGGSMICWIGPASPFYRDTWAHSWWVSTNKTSLFD